ncbi:hypothetical protein [Verminephrobacter aporrectodeae]|nr:hypothetical protein [Verminephrobacter aporrectodeae]
MSTTAPLQAPAAPPISVELRDKGRSVDLDARLRAALRSIEGAQQ